MGILNIIIQHLDPVVVGLNVVWMDLRQVIAGRIKIHTGLLNVVKNVLDITS